jgi:hypothetical protein
MHVCVRLEQHNALRILNQENEYIRVFATQMQMHDSLFCQQGILVQIDASPVIAIRHTVAALNAFDDFVKFRPKVWEPADACEILKLDDVNRLGFGLDPPQPLPESRSGWLQSP